MTTRIRLPQFILVILLLVGFFLRLNALSYPFQKNDARRDHLIMRHMVEYHEFPAVGPYNAFTGGKNSPVYFYLIAPFLLINTSFLFLSLINIIFQVATIYLLYELAKRLFGTQTALLSAFLVTFNLFALRQSSYIWQPWVMQPLMLLSCLLILISHLRKKYTYLLAGIIVFVFAGAIHNSALALIPFIVLVSVIILRRQKAKAVHYFGLLFCAAVSLFISFFPLIRDYRTSIPSPSRQLSEIFIDSVFQLPKNLLDNISYFTGSMLLDQEKITMFSYLLALITGTILFYYLFSVKNKNEKFYAMLLTSIIGLIVFLTSLIDVKAFIDFFGSHYFTPVFGLFIIFLARSLIFIFTKNNTFKMLGIFMLSLYIGLFSASIYVKFYKTPYKSSAQPAPVPAVVAIKKDIFDIKQEMGYDNYYFFNIPIYADNHHGWKYSPTVWAILEEDLNTKFVKLDDKESMGFRQIETDADYAFLVCPAARNQIRTQNECVQNFLAKNKNAAYVKQTFSEIGYAINLIKLNN
jgi:4-amino-4-deoxy-L-arabinose transferase-like glycosyltransferase